MLQLYNNKANQKKQTQNSPSPIIKKSIQHHLFYANFHTKTPYHSQIKPYDKQTQPTLFCKKSA